MTILSQYRHGHPYTSCTVTFSFFVGGSLALFWPFHFPHIVSWQLHLALQQFLLFLPLKKSLNRTDNNRTECLLSGKERHTVPSVLWHCWLGHLTRKNPSPIWPIMCRWDVKPYSINPSTISMCVCVYVCLYVCLSVCVCVVTAADGPLLQSAGVIGWRT